VREGGRPGPGLPSSLQAGPAGGLRGRNLGKTVENIQEKTERYPRNFIHYKEISIITIFKMFLHKQNKWKYNEHMSLFSDMVQRPGKQ
jgi:hypothetical protein